MFLIYYYPEWYKDLKKQKAKDSVKGLANLANTPIDIDSDKGKATTDGNYINFAHT